MSLYEVPLTEVTRLVAAARNVGTMWTVKGLDAMLVEAQLAKNVPLAEIRNVTPSAFKREGSDGSLPLELVAERWKWQPPESSLPADWAEHYIHGSYLVGLFGPHLRLAEGHELRYFSLTKKAIGGSRRLENRLFCVPRAQQRAPVTGLPARETVPGALEVLLDGLVGDDTPLSYFSLLLLLRAFQGLGYAHTGIEAHDYEVVARLDDFLVRSFWGKLFGGAPQLNESFLKRHGWEVRGALPPSLIPHVQMEADTVEVVFWLYREIAGERLYEQRARFERNSYHPEITLSEIAQGSQMIV